METLFCRHDGEKTTNMRMFWKRRTIRPSGYEKIHDTKKLILLLKATNKALTFHEIFMYVFVNKKVLQKGVKKVSTFNTQ